MDGFRPQSWWVMDYEKAGDLKQILSTIYERYLYKHDLELNADGEVRYLNERDEPLGF